MPKSTYEELVKICSDKGANFVVDAEGEFIDKSSTIQTISD